MARWSRSPVAPLGADCGQEHLVFAGSTPGLLALDEAIDSPLAATVSLESFRLLVAAD